MLTSIGACCLQRGKDVHVGATKIFYQPNNKQGMLFKQTLFLLLALVALAAANPSEDYQIGTALTDVTGPVADEEMVVIN